MITSLTLENFKSVQGKTTLPLPPLTVITGSNSSGKSTLLQALLVLSQSILHAGNDRQLVLNGSLTRLGQFQEIKNYFSEENKFTIGLTVNDTHSIQKTSNIAHEYLAKENSVTHADLSCSFTDRPIDPTRSNESNSFPQILEMSTVAYTSTGLNHEDHFERRISVKRHGWGVKRRILHELIESDAPSYLQEALAWTVTLDDSSYTDLDRSAGQSRIVGANFRHFFPRTLVERIDLNREYINTILNNIIGKRDSSSSFVMEWKINEYLNSIIIKHLHSTQSILDDNDPDQTLGSIQEKYKKLRPNDRLKIHDVINAKREEIIKEYLYDETPVFWLRSASLPRKITEGQNLIERNLNNIRYVGPLRVQPSPIYPIANTLGSRDVGPSGEWTAAVLDEYKDTLVPFLPPDHYVVDKEIEDLQEIPLIDAVNVWMKYLQVADSVATVDRGSLGHELLVTANGESAKVPLTHVGVGVSQCLPVVVSLLLAPIDSTTLLEQPELHLHPAVQSRLAEFILSMSITGRQCIVETHSEYLINKLRFLIASESDSVLSGSISVYFCENNSEGSVYNEIEINEFGRIANWPRGFFDQSNDDAEALVTAAIKKRRRNG